MQCWLFTGRTLTSAETSTIDLKDEKDGEDKDEKKEDEAKEDGQEAKLSDEQAQKLCKWLRSSLGSKKVKEVRLLMHTMHVLYMYTVAALSSWKLSMFDHILFWYFLN